MKCNSYEISKIIIYDENKSEQLPNCYYEGIYTTQTIGGDKYTNKDNYCNLFVDDLKKVNSNHIESNKRSKNNFVVIDKEASTYEAKYILYIHASNIGEIETETERRTDNVRNAVIYNKVVYFKYNWVVVKDSEYNYFKTFDEAIAKINNHNNIESIKDKIEDLQNRVSRFTGNEEVKKRNIEALQEKLSQGFQYMGFNYRSITKNVNTLYCNNYVDHYEPTKDYKYAEKIAQIMSKYIGYNHKVYTSEVLQLLNVLNISIKRGAK